MLNSQDNFHKPISNTGMEIKHASKSIQFVDDENNKKFADHRHNHFHQIPI